MRNEELQSFFQAYEERINKALADPDHIDARAMSDAYTESFLEAHPGGIQIFSNDEQFREAQQPAFEHRRRIGTRSMIIMSIRTANFDDQHSAATIRWMAVYERQSDRSEVKIEFDETYLVQFIDRTPKIFAYIAGDEEALLKKHGLPQ